MFFSSSSSSSDDNSTSGSSDSDNDSGDDDEDDNENVDRRTSNHDLVLPRVDGCPLRSLRNNLSGGEDDEGVSAPCDLSLLVNPVWFRYP